MPNRSSPRVIDAATASLQRFRGALARVGSRQELGAAVLDGLRGISAALRAAVVENGRDGALRVLASAGLSDGACALVAAHAPWDGTDDCDGETVWVSHLAPDPATLASRAAFAREGIVCVAYVPCCFGDRRIGALALCFDAPHSFTQHEAAAVASVAAETALMLEHLRQLAAPASFPAAELPAPACDDEKPGHEPAHSASTAADLLAEAREAVRMRDELLAVVSHDLRNPLNTISVASSLLEMSPSPEVSSRAQRSIVRAAKQMERLLKDLLDVSRAEAKGMSLERAPIDIVTLIDEAHALALPQAEDKQVKLERRVEADTGKVDGDHNRLLQVLGNLLGNAIKFVGPGGQVTIGAQQLYGQVRIWISDDGPGIAAEHLPRVFDRFWQANRSGSRGAGLGLTIAKSIIDAHGGQIGVHSQLGEGSTFFCWLPCLPGAGPARASENPARGDARESAAPTPTAE